MEVVFDETSFRNFIQNKIYSVAAIEICENAFSHGRAETMALSLEHLCASLNQSHLIIRNALSGCYLRSRI